LDSKKSQISLIYMNVSRIKLVGMALAIFTATIWLYWPCVHGGFLAWRDDDEYLRQAVRLRGFTWDAVKWAFTETRPYYHPLPRLSHVLDYQIWGTNPAGHHATSVVVHALNAALVFGFLWTLLGRTSLATGERLAMALGVAVVFAIHPLQVESVAWMSGRTQLMCTTFGIGSVWAYVAGARRWVVWTLYVGALLCKPMAVSFPFVILALDYFPLRRYEQLGWARLLGEKVILIALGVAMGALTTFTESRAGGLMVSLTDVALSQRLFLMFQSLAFYPWKLIWPAHMSPFYPLRSGLSLDQWSVLLSVLSVVIVTALAVCEARRSPAISVGWGAYVILVLPVSGLTQLGWSTVATRYAYVAMLPLLLLAGGAVVWLWRRSTATVRVALIGLLAVELCVFGFSTRGQIPFWHDSETLWRTVCTQFPDSTAANRSLMRIFMDQGRFTEALEYAQRYVETVPEYDGAHFDLGCVLARLGRRQEAMAQYEQALRINPDYVEAHVDLGNAFLQMGKAQDAIAEYEQALRIDPDHAEAHSNLGAIFQRMGKLQDAVAEYEQALRTKPDYVEAHFNLGLALEKLGRTPEAIEHYQQALKLRPDFAAASNALTRLRAGQ